MDGGDNEKSVFLRRHFNNGKFIGWRNAEVVEW